MTVALVPEGLLPTVTLSLARAAHTMAGRNALVRRLESVETLGSTTMICTDKTGTLTANQMSVVRVWTPTGAASVEGPGYEPHGAVTQDGKADGAVAELATAAARCAEGRAVLKDGHWSSLGDPMEVALRVLAMRAGLDLRVDEAARPERRRVSFDPERRRNLVVVGTSEAASVLVTGAPDAVLPLCTGDATTERAAVEVEALARQGLRVLGVAAGPLPAGTEWDSAPEALESELRLLGLVGLQDPPREGVAEAVRNCRSAHIGLIMITGDHPGTARAIADQVGLALPDSPVLRADELPADRDRPRRRGRRRRRRDRPGHPGGQAAHRAGAARPGSRGGHDRGRGQRRAGIARGRHRHRHGRQRHRRGPRSGGPGAARRPLRDHRDRRRVRAGPPSPTSAASSPTT